MAHCWLVKTEPSTYSITDLKRDGTTGWEGVRNYQARNTMRDLMRKGDQVLVYHSGEEPAAVGVAVVAGAARPDPTQWDPRSPYYDEKSTREDPRWMMVDLKFKTMFAQPVPLAVLRATPALKNMMILRQGNRLSVTPVTKEEFEAVLRLAATRGKTATTAAKRTTAAGAKSAPAATKRRTTGSRTSRGRA